MKPDQGWQHIFDRKGKEWIITHGDLVRRFFNKHHGADTMRDLRRGGLVDRTLTGLSDGLLWVMGAGNPAGSSPAGKARWKDMVDQGLGERLDRFLGVNRQRSDASQLLRALTGG